MAGKHAKTLTEFFEAWCTFDLPRALACVSDDIVFEPDLKGDRHEGREAVAAIWGNYMEIMKSYSCQTLALVEQDDVAIIERLEVIGSGSGGEMHLPITGVFGFDPAGKIVRWRDYWDTSMVPAH